MSSVLDLGATLTVDRAASLRDELAAALAEGGKVSIVFSAVEDLDLSCLQVLYAATLSARAAGRELHFTGSLSRRVSNRLKSCGFLGKDFERAEDLESSLGFLS
jgi:anti-anti-sigma regulatory factor